MARGGQCSDSDVRIRSAGTLSCERRNQEEHWNTHDSSAGFEFEIPKMAPLRNDGNFKFAALEVLGPGPKLNLETPGASRLPQNIKIGLRDRVGVE